MLFLVLPLLLGQTDTRYPAYSLVPLSGVTIHGLPAITSHICVDQFGYLPSGAKVAVISDRQKGYNAFDHYQCGDKLQVRDRSGKTVFVGNTTTWHNGATDEDSGDK